MSRRVKQTARYHIVCGYQGLKASCFTPKVPKFDRDGNAIKSKFSKGDHDAFICQDVDHVFAKKVLKEGYQFRDNPNSQYVNVVQNWATSKPALDAMEPDQKRACNALKAFLRSRKTMLWYHKNGHECDVASELGQTGAHFHIIVESTNGSSGDNDVEPHQCYAYRKLVGELKRAGGYSKCQKIKHQNMLGILCYLAQSPREYFGSNTDLFRMYYNQRVIIPLRRGKSIPEICDYDNVDHGQELLDQVKVLIKQIDSEAAKVTKNAFEAMDDSSDNEDTLDESDNETCEEVEMGNQPASKVIKSGASSKKRMFDEDMEGEIDLDAPSTSKKRKTDDDTCSDTEPLELDVSAVKHKTPYQGKITQEHKIAFIKKLLLSKTINTFDEFYAYIQDNEDTSSLYEQKIMHVFRSCMVSHAQKTFETAEKQVNVKHVLNTKDRTYRHYQCDKKENTEYTVGNERLSLTSPACGISLFSNWCIENGKCLPRLLIDMYAVLTCLIPRKNTFVFVGEPKSGKTFWLNSILDHAPHVIGSFAKSSTFKFQDCASKLLIRQDEWKIDPGDGNIYKQICGGEPFSADIKNGASLIIGRTPIFVGTNYDPLQYCGKQDKEALADRMFIYDKLHHTNTINVFERMGAIWINPLTWRHLFKWVHVKMSVMSNADYIEVSQMTDKELVGNLNAYLVQTVSESIDVTKVVQVIDDDDSYQSD